MAVYVDEAVWEWRGRKWCHLLADTLEELHDFAESMGLRRSWFQGKAKYPHYDITAEMRHRAVRLGAREIDYRTALCKGRTLRASVAGAPEIAQGQLKWD